MNKILFIEIIILVTTKLRNIENIRNPHFLFLLFYLIVQKNEHMNKKEIKNS